MQAIRRPYTMSISPTPAPHAVPDASAPLVLVVDDDRAVAAVVARLLQRSGYRTQVANSGREAVVQLGAALPGARPDVILCDVRMPDLPGPMLREELAALAPEIPLVFMTGHLSVELAQGVHMRPDQLVLMKPFTTDVLVAAIGEALTRADRNG